MAGHAKQGPPDPLTVPVIEEELQVGTRMVETGRGVRIHKRVVTHPATVEESLVRGEVEVRHVPIDRVVDPGEAPVTRYEGETLVVPVLEEVLVLERRVRIKEELHVTVLRREETHAETVMLKSEQVSVERFDDGVPPPPK